MTDHQFEIDYNGGEPTQKRIPADALPPTSIHTTAHPPKRRFKISEAGKATIFLILGGGILLTSEAVLPEGWRLTDRIGISETRMEIERVRMEKQAQAELEDYTRKIDIANQQNLELVKAEFQAQLQLYDSTYNRAQVFAQSTAHMQEALNQQRLQLARSTQSTDVSVINFTRLFGRIANAVEPGRGDGALTYANNLREELYGELNRSTQAGTTISIEGWDTDLPSPYEVQARFEQFKFAPLPAAPTIGLTRSEKQER